MMAHMPATEVPVVCASQVVQDSASAQRLGV